jgi:uncharacterized protein
MRVVAGQVVLAPTDLSTFVTCRHLTGLDLAVAHGALARPASDDPYAVILRRQGEAHEAHYIASLQAQGLSVVTIARETGPPTAERLDRQADETHRAMQAGAAVIVQARLAHGRLAGYADVLRRVERPSALGTWAYEPHDTKLARETRAGTILQLCAYADLLSHLQGVGPERIHVVTPDPLQPVQSHRTTDYMAYYRVVRRSLESAVAAGHQALRDAHYPEPIDHCQVCRWDAMCQRRRRADDHTSLIAGAARVHRVELASHGHTTLAGVAAMPVPVPFQPTRGARDTYDRLGDQARVQHRQRREGHPVFERLPLTSGEGLSRLPEPSPGDVFLDLEGARFAREGGREYLFGIVSAERAPLQSGQLVLWDDAQASRRYRGWWATTDEEERRAFEAAMDLIVEAWRADPGMHVYHFNHYEPTAFKRLVGRHVTRAEALDRLLRAERFVDLYPIVRQSVRCGVESYSIKQLEQYYAFTRRTPLENVAQPLLAIALALEAGAPDAVTDEVRAAVQGYNEDDCRSTAALRDWLERLRADVVTDGTALGRPQVVSGDPSAAVSDLQDEVEALRARLIAAGETLLAYLIDWHEREENADWWEYFRLVELPDDELLDEGKAIAALEFVDDVEVVVHKRTGRPTGSVVRRFRYAPQEVQIGSRGAVVLRSGAHYGTIEAHDRVARTVDIKSTASALPAAVFSNAVVPQETLQRAVMRLAERLLAGDDLSCGVDLLRRRTPRLRSGTFAGPTGESVADYAVRLASHLDRTTLAVQGPPGAGKSVTGARMIVELVRAGRKVGVTATGHKVIVNLMDEVIAQVRLGGLDVRVGRKPGDAEDAPEGPIRLLRTNDEARDALASGACQVLGGTAWMWSREEFGHSVDVLFVDEAGQMSLANTLAVSHAADSLVLLGDPRQLEQPQKASHPDGVGVSALAHVLAEAETMPEAHGLFLPVTYRMAPAITRFTSEVFYAGQLQSHSSIADRALRGSRDFDGAGLWLIPVAHDGNRTSAPEEVEAIAGLVASLVPAPLSGHALRVMAPFNAQVNRLADRLAPWGVPVGTVDKFQGQTAEVAIYSMTASRPEDAPRGMEFLYSLHRLNVATSRARSAVFLVCSPLLLEPECRTPRQMRLANALCRYREWARQS